MSWVKKPWDWGREKSFLYMPLHLTHEEADEEMRRLISISKPPENDNTWYAPGCNWRNTRTPWD